ncbi:MAG: hypothetical protein JNM77_11980 [Pseudonocardia sp.]|nr:hypothetical protein [Pseudonocardia sp.]
MSADLDEAVYTLLTPARGVLARHPRDERHQCRRCREPWPCFEIDTAIQALDLVIRVHAASRHAGAAAGTKSRRAGDEAAE